MTAKELLEKTFNGAKLANTKIGKIGKINEDIAFEIAVGNYGECCGKAFLTLVSKNGVVDEIAYKKRFDNKEEALEEVNRLKFIAKKG